ncbi:hypothetical protein VHEMI08756 [[Torrubiella] hemipterigena]|uniref:Uncharacterized protein n=1 Tax=[Torrubiella] hemipterigena TaxID=1531966 RepID=A0A0A1TNT4_9HYPO|nr:hypothetical protein VHEMI08756 [[Torrubiella] hemipterigena]
MAFRRAPLARVRLNSVAARSTPLQDHRSSIAPTLSCWRLLATHSASTAHTTHSPSEPIRQYDDSLLSKVLAAIYSRDYGQLRNRFLKWIQTLANPEAKHHGDAMREVQGMASATFSEVLRNLDPANNHELDSAQGIAISQGLARFSDAGKLVDEFGVRRHHRDVLRGVQLLLSIRRLSEQALTTADYEILIRIAGTAVDRQAAKEFWTAMVGDGLRDARTAQTWNEFIKSRFMTEPAYYQFDRSRVAVLARDLYRNQAPMPMATLKRLDRMRFAINANTQLPFNRRRDEPGEDIRRLLRHRQDYRGYSSHWIRAQYYGHEMNQDLLCTSLKAFSRSSSLTAIKELILKPYYNIMIEDGDIPGTYNITGGRKFSANHPLRPTTELLNALTDSLGSMAQISLATQLLYHFSVTYDLPVPHTVWSNLLNWTYLNASKPFASMRAASGNYPSTTITAADVRATWDAMTSAPNNIIPSIDDYRIYLKTLIAQRSFFKALSVLRDNIIPHYRLLSDNHDAALADEVLQTDASPTPISADVSRRRARAAVLKDAAHHEIASALVQLLQATSGSRTYRESAVTTAELPNLVAEFAEFLPEKVRYRTAQGSVVLERPGAEEGKILHWRKQTRTTLPQKLAGIYARNVEGSDQPDFEYPEVRSMNIQEWVPVPRRRLGRLTKPGQSPNWWQAIEDESFA